MIPPTPDASRPRWWRWPAAALIGLAAFGMSCCFMPPLGACRSLGLDFAVMASDPFGWHGPTPHRLLGPLLAWLLGLGGDRYWIFAHATVVVFLALVPALAMQRGVGVLGAALLAGVVAITGAVEAFKELVGYAEPLCYAVLLCAVMLVHRAAWFWLVMFLGLLAHEGVAFVWPWLLLVKRHENAGLRRGDALGFALVVAAYAAVRWSIFAAATQPVRTAEEYAGGGISAGTLGMWAMTGLSIGVYFGLLPILLAWHARACGWRAAGAPILLALAGIFAMCTFAVDLPRFVGYLALPVVLAGIALLQRPDGVPWLAALGVATAVAIVLQRRVVSMIYDEFPKHLPEPMPALVIALWPLFAAYAAALAAMVALGFAFARRARA